MECFTGDPEFREAILAEPHRAGALSTARGIGVDVQGLAPMWRDGVRPELTNEAIQGSPLAVKWARWMSDLMEFRALMRLHGAAEDGDPRFRAWRLRRVAQADSELGDARHAIIHSVLALELCDGCSAGCWFCGLSADRLRDVFAYSPDNARLWREVLAEAQQFLGSAVQTGFCYWATDPFDNPDYLRFAQVFHEVVGVLPQTTTALAFKDLDWARELVAAYRDSLCVPPRFSILSTKVLRLVHEHFTPEELLLVELVQQQDGAVVVKAKAGRAATAERDGDASVDIPPHDMGTIACVSGFLVNMPQRSIKLVTPCRASEEWPLGYRVFAEEKFDNAADVRAFMNRCADEQMTDRLAGGDALAFRQGLEYARNDEGFAVATPYLTTRYTGAPFLGPLGDMIAQGEHTVGDAIGRAMAEGADLFEASGALETLFCAGLLDEAPLSHANRAKAEAMS